jgi:putative membrane protein (TIGR04086 family)
MRENQWVAGSLQQYRRDVDGAVRKCVHQVVQFGAGHVSAVHLANQERYGTVSPTEFAYSRNLRGYPLGVSQSRARRTPGKGDDKRVEIKGDPAFFRRINYLAVAVGFVVAMVVYLVLGSLVVTPDGQLSQSSGAYFAVSVLAMFCGGLAAGMIEPKYGVLNGPLVAVIYIFVGFILTFNAELAKVKIVGPLGLGPMRVDRVFAADVPQLFFASLGGWVAGQIELRVRAPRRRASSGKGPGSQG